MYVPGHIFSIIKSRSLKVRCHVPSTVGPGKESFTSTLGSQTLEGQLHHVATQSSSFISCTTPDKTLGVQLLVTLIAEFPWVVAPGACFRKLFPVVFLSSNQNNLTTLLPWQPQKSQIPFSLAAETAIMAHMESISNMC